MGTGLALDSAGNIFVTGYKTSATSGKDYVTIKYSSAGTQRWVSTFDGGINADDSATAIVVNQIDTNKIYVTGFSYNGSTKDYWTLKYDGAGNLKWDIGFNNLNNGDDRATAIALDTLGNIIVTGQNKLNDSTHTYKTVKYIEKNTTLPQDTISVVSNSYVFTENRGQLFGDDLASHPEVRYYTPDRGTYFMDTAVAFILTKLDTGSSPNDSLIRVDMKFIGANSDLHIRSLDQRDEINNFYYAHIPEGRENVHNYDKLISFNVWNNVDVGYGSNLKGLKYYFICKPIGGGGSVSQIDLKYEGADSVKIGANGELIIYTRFGNIVQPKAAAWQLDASGNYTSLGWQPSYQIVGTNEVKFTGLGSYNTAYPLIIAVDRGNIFPASIQNLDWSTYFGGSYRDVLPDLDVLQSDGSTYYCGWTQSWDFPYTSGAYQTIIGGATDAMAAKMDSSGHQVYGTFYGNNADQTSYTCAVAPNGNLFIGGMTYKIGSTNIPFPATQPAGAYVDSSFGGGQYDNDAFIAAFTPTGQLYWSTYYGGTGAWPLLEQVTGMKFDANGNLYVLMNGDTTTPRMIEPGAYNDATLRGGMILKFDSNLSRKWATPFSTKGGNATRIDFDVNGNFYVTGNAKDTLLPVKNPGGYYMDSTLNGTSDAYIAMFDSADSLLWCTYFGGSSIDYSGALMCQGGNVYMTGTTTSSDFPVQYSGLDYIDSTLNGTNDVFVAKFKTGQQIWTTYLGGDTTEIQGDLAYDASGNIYVSGYTLSPNFPHLAAPNVYSDTAYASCWLCDDVFLVLFDYKNQLQWASFFGGLGDESTGRGLGMYQSDYLYICGTVSVPSTASPNFPTQNLGGGAYWQPVLGGINESAQYNGFISRFGVSSFIALAVNEPTSATNGTSSMLIFPNPTDGQFNVQINSQSENRKIEVYNTLGQVIQTIEIPDGEASQMISLNLIGEATGVYYVVLSDETGSTSSKIIKQ